MAGNVYSYTDNTTNLRGKKGNEWNRFPHEYTPLLPPSPTLPYCSGPSRTIRITSHCGVRRNLPIPGRRSKYPLKAQSTPSGLSYILGVRLYQRLPLQALCRVAKSPDFHPLRDPSSCTCSSLVLLSPGVCPPLRAFPGRACPSPFLV